MQVGERYTVAVAAATIYHMHKHTPLRTHTLTQTLSIYIYQDAERPCWRQTRRRRHSNNSSYITLELRSLKTQFALDPRTNPVPVFDSFGNQVLEFISFISDEATGYPLTHHTTLACCLTHPKSLSVHQFDTIQLAQVNPNNWVHVWL